MKIKAVTVQQPNAAYIERLEKFVENRTWSTSHRGLLAIHAGSGTDYLDKSELKNYITGAVVAICDLVACVHVDQIDEMASSSVTENLPVSSGSSITWKMLCEHDHTEGPWCWVLENVKRIKPVPISGKQGLWTFEYDKGLDVEIVEICPQCNGLYYQGPTECDCGFSGEYAKAELRRL